MNEISRYAWGDPPFPKFPAETVDSMAEIGESFMDAMPKDYSWCQSPAEIIVDLQNERDALHCALQSLTEEVAAIITFDGDESLQAKIANAKALLTTTKVLAP